MDTRFKIYAIMIRARVLQIQELKTQYKSGASVLDSRVEIHASISRDHVFWVSVCQYEQVASVSFRYKSQSMCPYE